MDQETNAANANESVSRPPALRRRAGRLAASLIVLALGLAALWQLGLLSSHSDGEATPGGLTLAPAVALPAADAEPREGRQAPDFEFSTLDGRRLKLSDFRGQAVLLNFWATWCTPCRAEMPDLEAALREYGPRGFVVIAVNAGEPAETALRWLNDVGVELSAFAYDPTQRVSRLYAVTGLPVSFFLDAGGRITRVQTGIVTPGIARTAIEEALASGARMP